MKRGIVVKIIKNCVFLVIGLIIFAKVTNVMIIPYEQQYHTVKGFYEEPYDSLDAVYIGASNVLAFWIAPIAWEKYGIKVYPYSTGGQPLAAIPYLIEDAHKTEPNALIVIGINHVFLGPPSFDRIHQLADSMPFSLTKVKMLWELCEACDLNYADRLEYYIPIIRFHSRWGELSTLDFHRDLNDLKGVWGYSDNLFYGTNDLTGKIAYTEARVPLNDYAQKALNHILDYCDENDVKILFVTAPAIYDNETTIGMVNTAKDEIMERGYTVLDMIDKTAEIGLNPETDYLNGAHTNIHGALKVTDYMSEYLLNNCSFVEENPDAGNSSWDSAYDRYCQMVLQYLTPEEIESLP